MSYQIPVRCCHCAEPIPGAWTPWHLLWSVCRDCRAWEQWLWHQRSTARKEVP
jgi:hypothetical protein